MSASCPKRLLAPLGKKPSVWCECLFVDPIADIAILGTPDNQELSKEADAYEALVETAIALTVAEPPSEPIPEEVAKLTDLEKTNAETTADLAKAFGLTAPTPRKLAQWAMRTCPAFLLSLSNQWFPCTIEHFPNGMLNIRDAANGIAGGMSGSPIIAEDGTAIGVVCLGSGGLGDELPKQGGPNPRLMGNLPGWFLQQLADA